MYRAVDLVPSDIRAHRVYEKFLYGDDGKRSYAKVHFSADRSLTNVLPPLPEPMLKVPFFQVTVKYDLELEHLLEQVNAIVVRFQGDPTSVRASRGQFFTGQPPLSLSVDNVFEELAKVEREVEEVRRRIERAEAPPPNASVEEQVLFTLNREADEERLTELTTGMLSGLRQSAAQQRQSINPFVVEFTRVLEQQINEPSFVKYLVDVVDREPSRQIEWPKRIALETISTSAPNPNAQFVFHTDDALLAAGATIYTVRRGAEWKLEYTNRSASGVSATLDITVRKH